MTKIFHLTLVNLPHLNKFNINMNLNTQIWSLCLLFFYILSKAFQKWWIMVFISSKKFFLFLGYWIFCQFFLSLSTASRFKGSEQKINSSKNVLQLKERLITSSRPFLFFIILSIRGALCAKEKMKLTFSSPPLKYVLYGLSWNFLKFFPCIGCFGLYTKIKKGYGNSFQCRFSAYFFHKNVSF